MHVVLAVPRALLTVVTGVVMTLICAPLAYLVVRLRPSSPLVEGVISTWARSWLVASGTHLEVSGRENVDPGRSYVVVANHQSNLDIMVCFTAVPLPLRFLAKKELFRIPILSSAMRAVGMVEVDRTVRGTFEAINRQARSVIERGHSIIVYPEGTRSLDGEIHPFKKGAFTLAVATGMAVLPVTMQGTWEAWRPHRPLVRGGRVQVVIDPPIPTDGLGREDVGHLREEVEGIVRKRYEELRGRRGQS